MRAPLGPVDWTTASICGDWREMQAEPAATPAWAESLGTDPLAIVTPSRPCCFRRFTVAPTKSRGRCVGKLSILATCAGADANAAACMRPVPEEVDLPAQEGRLARAPEPPTGPRTLTSLEGTGMPIVTESEVAKSRCQAHDNDACGFAHGTSPLAGVHPCDAADLRRYAELRDKRRDGDEHDAALTSSLGRADR
jgi:hypothetical protein